jgi:16S rRNA (guanine527-N7)-methyltransferase
VLVRVLRLPDIFFMKLIEKYFPALTDLQHSRLQRLLELYPEWNEKINVISRKDIDHLEERHILHSMGIAKVADFSPGSRILDAGTGGGLPGIPLAIIYPACEFLLADSTRKKIQVAGSICSELGLDNVTALWTRYEDIRQSFDIITGRAVTELAPFTNSLRKLLKPGKNKLTSGFLYLKGGDFEDDLARITMKWRIYRLSDHFGEEFFQTKKVVHLF